MRFKQLHKWFALTAPLLSYLSALIILGFMLLCIALWSIWHLMSAFSKICAPYSQYFWYDIWPLFRFQSRTFFQCCFSWAAVVQDGPFHREKEKSYGSVTRSFQLGCGLCRKVHKKWVLHVKLAMSEEQIHFPEMEFSFNSFSRTFHLNAHQTICLLICYASQIMYFKKWGCHSPLWFIGVISIAERVPLSFFLI